MSARWMDLNADLGESFGRWQLGDDAAMLQVVTSANVACGFHAGDPGVLRVSCEQAAAGGVAIGAQVSYRDLAGFGRRFMDVSHADLRDDVIYQLGALMAFAQVAGTAVTYVKPHGALYHAAATRPEQADAIVTAITQVNPALAVLSLPGSELLAAAQRAGLATVAEAFADRRYTRDGGLVPRTEPGAVITDAGQVRAQVRQLVTAGTVTSADGTAVAVAAQSLCVHGDTPSAVTLAQAVRAELRDAGCDVRSFTSARAAP